MLMILVHPKEDNQPTVQPNPCNEASQEDIHPHDNDDFKYKEE